MDNVFNARIEEVSDNLSLTVLEIGAITPELASYIDQNLVSVCAGKNATWTLDDIKIQIQQLFRNKEAKIGQEYSKWEMGAVAEIFIHLYLNSRNVVQECMFFNLEENSVKKGFDGYYTEGDEKWIMESKSGSITSKGIAHVSKLREALRDLEDKVSGKNAKNNPWREAYNHANTIDVNSADQIRKYLQQMANEFSRDIFHEVKEFNLIPCATIYFEDRDFPTKDSVLAESQTAANGGNFKKAHLVCVSNKSVDIFKSYAGIAAQ